MNEQADIFLSIAPECADSEAARRLRERFPRSASEREGGLTLRLDADGLALLDGDQALRGDLTHMLPRLKHGLSQELLVRAAKIRDHDGPLTAVDATAGLGEDSLLLAAAGFRVTLYERNPVIFELLRDAVLRAAQQPELAGIVSRMELVHADSIAGMAGRETAPDVILLDPMFPERQKSALVKKKLQMIQKLELPCLDERALLLAAMECGPKKLIVKRPPKGPFLAGLKSDHSITGKAVRFDVFVSPRLRLHKFQPLLERESNA